MDARIYTDYFRQMAILHKDIRHEAASEDPDGPGGKRAFTLFDAAEVTTGLRSSIDAGPVLHLHLYEWHVQDNEAFDVRYNYTAAFMITLKANERNVQLQAEAYADAERITGDILAKIRLDHSQPVKMCDWPLGILDWSRAEVTPVGNVWGGRYGWYVQLPFQVRASGLPDAERVANAFYAPEGDRIHSREHSIEFS